MACNRHIYAKPPVPVKPAAAFAIIAARRSRNRYARHDIIPLKTAVFFIFFTIITANIFSNYGENAEYAYPLYSSKKEIMTLKKNFEGIGLKEEITILVHGFNKSSGDMNFLRNGLTNYGIKCLNVKLPATFSSIDDCVKSLNLQICNQINQYEKVNFIGHSIGGLIIRSYINKYNIENVSKCVFISTPNHGSKLAEIAGKIPLYKIIFKPIAEMQPNEKNIYLLKNKDIKIGLIIGEKNNLMLGKIYLSKQSDGRIEIQSALSEDANDKIILPYGHKKIHHNELTLQLVMNYLKNGSFIQE